MVLQWQWLLWRGRLRDAVLPYVSDSQERFMWRVGECAMADRALNIVTTFRGCRKTKTAERMAFRSTFLWPLFPRYWRRRYIHIKNVTQYQAQFSSESARAMERYKERLWAYGLRAGSAALLTFLTTGLVVPASTDSTLRTLSLLSGIPSFDESLGLATFFVFFFAFVKRQRVYIVDDALRYGAPHGHKRHNLQLMMDDIKCYGCAHAVVMLSSNEGVHRLFSDRNETTFLRHSLPSASSYEFLLALQKSMLSLSPVAHYRGYNEGSTPPLTAASVERMQEHYGMHHHTHSVRWWVSVHQHLGGSRQALLDVCHGTRTLASQRSVLETIAIELDLQAEPAGRTFAFAYSPSVPIEASLRGYFTPDEIDRVAETLHMTEFPRRLLLAAALVITDASTPTAASPSTDILAEMVPTPPPAAHRFLHLVWNAIRPLPNVGEDVFAEDVHCTSAMFSLRVLVHTKLQMLGGIKHVSAT